MEACVQRFAYIFFCVKLFSFNFIGNLWNGLWNVVKSIRSLNEIREIEKSENFIRWITMPSQNSELMTLFCCAFIRDKVVRKWENKFHSIYRNRWQWMKSEQNNFFHANNNNNNKERKNRLCRSFPSWISLSCIQIDFNQEIMEQKSDLTNEKKLRKQFNLPTLLS